MTLRNQLPLLSADISDVMNSDPTTGLTILTEGGVIKHMNSQATRLLFDEDRDPLSHIDLNLYELGFPRAWGDELMGLIRDVLTDQSLRMLRSILHGRQQLSSLSPVRDAMNTQDLVLIMTRRALTTCEREHMLVDGHEVVYSDFVSLGELSVLTARELEILSMLGLSMTIKEIATALVRSAKTVENHRESIGRKLHKARGVELAVIAQRAGLCIDDCRRIRLD